MLDTLFGQPQASAVTSYSDFGWSDSTGLFPATGNVTPDGALKVSTFFAGVRLLSFLVGRLPIGIFKQGTRDKDTGHWAYRLLAQRPNHWQTPFAWKQWMFSSVLRHGNGYSYIASRSELVPIHKTRVHPQRLASNAIVYKIDRSQETAGLPDTIPFERMVHWRSPFGDGLEGMSLLSYARDTLSGAQSQQDYANKQFSQGLLHRFATKLLPGASLSESAQNSLKQMFNDKAGIKEAGRVLVLPGGLELTPLTMSMADAQFLQQEEFTMVQLAQFLGIPPHMLELVSRTTSWGTGIAEQTIGFMVYTMDPWLTELEESIDRDMLDSGTTHYSKFNRKAVLAANMRERASFYQALTGIKAMTPNEVRDAEDMDPVEWGDEPLPAPNESPDGGNGGSGQAMAIAEESAGRLIRKEIARITHLAQRTASDTAAFQQAVTEFYAEHAEDVAQALHMDLGAAIDYSEEQRTAVLAGGIGVMGTWESERVAALAELALRETGAASSERRSGAPRAYRIERDEQGRMVGLIEREG